MRAMHHRLEARKFPGHHRAGACPAASGVRDEEVFALPELSGPEEILDIEHFRIHYTFSGEDAVTPISYHVKHRWSIFHGLSVSTKR